jgi:hypothetical protein
VLEMNGSIQWSDIAPLCGILAVIGGVYWRGGIVIATLKADIANVRIEMAREYVSRETVTSVEGRLTSAIEKLGDRLDNILRELSSGRGLDRQK